MLCNLEMNPLLKTTLFHLILIFAHIPCYLCQRNEICRQSLHCGNIRDISYPFYGGDRPAYCGYPGFELDCRDQTLMFNISTMLYQVLEIDDVTRTIVIARQDLLNNTCPSGLRNTTLDFQLLDYSTNDQNVTLYYGCTSNQVQVSNQLISNCSRNDTGGFSFYVTGETLDPALSFSCSGNIFVPVNQNAAQQLANRGTSLRNALASGFSVQWSANDRFCDTCLESGGVCGFDEVRYSFACYCEDGPHAVSCPRTGNGEGLSEPEKIGTLVAMLGITCIIIPSILLICHFTNICTSDDPDEESNETVEKFIHDHGSLAPRRYTYYEIKKITKSFADKLGQGGFGSVYKGTLQDGRHVAVKVLNQKNSNGEEFINEVASISRTSHVNIVNLLGFCYGKSKRALVYEFMSNKSLDRYIYQNGSPDKDCVLEWNKLYDIAVGVARGLEYLHRGCNTRIVHFDIKPQNILLDEAFCPKISDFGLAKLCQKQQSILTSVFGARGTIGYIAPEVFCRNFGSVSHKSDVYSYGMMVLEMAGAREIEKSSRTWDLSENYFPDRIYEQGIVHKFEIFDEIMSKEEVETLRKMFLIGFWCIQTVPSERPSMSKVVEMFEGSLESIPIPPKPFLSSPMLSQQLFSSSLAVELVAESINED